MAWTTPSIDDVLSELAPAEASALKAIAGGDYIAPILDRAVNAARGAIRAGGYELGPNGTIPDQLSADVVAIARWRCLTKYPQLKTLQTPDRKDAAKDAQARLDLVANQKLKIDPYEDPAHPRHDRPAPPAGTWNSENKLVMRTHPVPPPGQQFQPTPENQPPYANPRQRDEPGRPLKPGQGYPDE